MFLCPVEFNTQGIRFGYPTTFFFCRADKVAGRADNAIVLTDQVNRGIPCVGLHYNVLCGLRHVGAERLTQM